MRQFWIVCESSASLRHFLSFFIHGSSFVSVGRQSTDARPIGFAIRSEPARSSAYSELPIRAPNVRTEDSVPDRSTHGPSISGFIGGPTSARRGAIAEDNAITRWADWCRWRAALKWPLNESGFNFARHKVGDSPRKQTLTTFDLPSACIIQRASSNRRIEIVKFIASYRANFINCPRQALRP